MSKVKNEEEGCIVLNKPFIGGYIDRSNENETHEAKTKNRQNKDKHHELTRTEKVGAFAHFADLGTVQRLRSSSQTGGYRKLSR